MSLYAFENKRPLIPATSFVHPQATVIGDVELGEHCYIGPGAVIRGDYGKIVIGRGSNVQDNCVVHCDPDAIAIIEENVIVGHGAIVHGPCLIKQGSMVGMGSIVSTGSEVGTESILAAGSLLPPGRNIPARKMAVGNPVSFFRDITEEHLAMGRLGVHLYQGLAARCLTGLYLIDE